MDVCSQFLNNPSVNPRTGRRIKIGGPVYRALVAECGVPTVGSAKQNITISQVPSLYTAITVPPVSQTLPILPVSTVIPIASRYTADNIIPANKPPINIILPNTMPRGTISDTNSFDLRDTNKGNLLPSLPVASDWTSTTTNQSKNITTRPINPQNITFTFLPRVPGVPTSTTVPNITTCSGEINPHNLTITERNSIHKGAVPTISTGLPVKTYSGPSNPHNSTIPFINNIWMGTVPTITPGLSENTGSGNVMYPTSPVTIDTSISSHGSELPSISSVQSFPSVRSVPNVPSVTEYEFTSGVTPTVKNTSNRGPVSTSEVVDVSARLPAVPIISDNMEILPHTRQQLPNFNIQQRLPTDTDTKLLSVETVSNRSKVSPNKITSIPAQILNIPISSNVRGKVPLTLTDIVSSGDVTPDLSSGEPYTKAALIKIPEPFPIVGTTATNISDITSTPSMIPTVYSFPEEHAIQYGKLVQSLETLQETLVNINKDNLRTYSRVTHIDKDTNKEEFHVLMYSETIARDEAIKRLWIRNKIIGNNISRVNNLLRRDLNRLDPNTLSKHLVTNLQEEPFIALYKNRNVYSVYDAMIPIAHDIFEVFTDASFCNLYNLMGSGLSNIDPIGVASFSVVGVSEANRNNKSIFRMRTYTHLVPFYVSSSTEAEIYAIYAALRLYKGKSLIINTDSQAAQQSIGINGIMSVNPTSVAYTPISQCINAIRAICLERNILITWVPAHHYVTGVEEFNIAADVAARDTLHHFVPRCYPERLGLRYQAYLSLMDLTIIPAITREVTNTPAFFSSLIQLQQALQRIEEEIEEFIRGIENITPLTTIRHIKQIVSDEIRTYRNLYKIGQIKLPALSIYLLDNYSDVLWPPFVREKNEIIRKWRDEASVARSR